MLIASLMIGSAALRFGISAPAIARELAESEPGTAPANTVPAANPDTLAASTPAELQLLLGALRQREQAIAAREAEIEDRMKALAVADAAVGEKLAALASAEERLTAALALADGAAEGDLSRLTDVYEKMKPKESAALFEQMAPEFAAGFLARMAPHAAAGIMAGMQPQSAYAISVVLAGRNANAPKQ
jgi:flagellar motility protein MotE (MotC chaperone)